MAGLQYNTGLGLRGFNLMFLSTLVLAASGQLLPLVWQWYCLLLTEILLVLVFLENFSHLEPWLAAQQARQSLCQNFPIHCYCQFHPSNTALLSVWTVTVQTWISVNYNAFQRLSVQQHNTSHWAVRGDICKCLTGLEGKQVKLWMDSISHIIILFVSGKKETKKT